MPRGRSSASRAGPNRDGDSAGDAAYRVGGGKGLIAHGDDRHPAGEGVHAIVPADANGERVVGGQHHAGVRVGGGEGHRALIIGVDIAIGSKAVTVTSRGVPGTAVGEAVIRKWLAGLGT